jgi:hypothetical protein
MRISDCRFRIADFRAAWIALAVGILLLTSGCSEEIDTVYGRRAGLIGGDSVNGTAVLGRMFEKAGHRVRTKRTLTDAMMTECDVIVWFPDDFQAPSQEVTGWFDDWLSYGGRTVIYVGRDFDAAPGYYDKVIPTAPADQQPELKRQRLDAKSEFDIMRNTVSAQTDCDWFTIDTTTKKRTVKSLSGPWSDGIDASKTEIELHSRLKPRLDEDFVADEGDAEDTSKWFEVEEDQPDSVIDSTDVLLETPNDILITRLYYQYGNGRQIIVVANGSFLLNLPLVNHEHRKLASRLIDEVGAPQQSVVFLESGFGGPRIMAEEPEENIPSGLGLFMKRPLDVVLFHVAILGLVFCLSRWPVFGRERRPPRPSVSDFGRHVEALGELLERTGDREFAAARIKNYQQSQHESEIA